MAAKRGPFVSNLLEEKRKRPSGEERGGPVHSLLKNSHESRLSHPEGPDLSGLRQLRKAPSRGGPEGGRKSQGGGLPGRPRPVRKGTQAQRPGCGRPGLRRAFPLGGLPGGEPGDRVDSLGGRARGGGCGCLLPGKASQPGLHDARVQVGGRPPGERGRSQAGPGKGRILGTVHFERACLVRGKTGKIPRKMKRREPCLDSTGRDPLEWGP